MMLCENIFIAMSLNSFKVFKMYPHFLSSFAILDMSEDIRRKFLLEFMVALQIIWPLLKIASQTSSFP
ncbi:hypothetical protein L2E82_17390 [Cichorium intybus]|uniref:Uncharacterized protein n=1 Tax=Cichorium intybus TaxID=13427 RepID=A0ACB9F843_CICIN|nr:hypothetical protein L2E82_17390 [Cichorium intybus]